MPQTTTYDVSVKYVTLTESLYKRQKRCVKLKQKITGFKQNASYDYIETDVDYFNIPFDSLVKQCLDNIEGFADFYRKKEEQAILNNSTGIETAHLSALLLDANLTIERTKHFAGEEYTSYSGETSIYQHDCYTTVITSIKITPKMQQLLDKAIHKIEVCTPNIIKNK